MLLLVNLRLREGFADDRVVVHMVVKSRANNNVRRG